MADPRNSRSSVRRPIALSWKKSAPEDSLRDTGIPLVGKIPWGTHIGLFCETTQDQLEAVSAYFAPADAENEQCIWVISPPVTEEDVMGALRGVVADLERRREEGSFEVLLAEDWYYEDGHFDWLKIVSAWHKRVDDALAKGFAGVRAAGQICQDMCGWPDIVAYERQLEASLAERRIIVLCIYMLHQSRPAELLDLARNHQCIVARRRGNWEFLQLAGNDDAKREIQLLNGDLDILPRQFADGLLTERERVVLAQIVRGASSKEIARTLGISPRTIDFHRANMMRKLGAKNTAELVGKILGTT